jgi:hypothetical protein
MYKSMERTKTDKIFLFQREDILVYQHIRASTSSAGILTPAMMVSVPSYFKEIYIYIYTRHWRYSNSFLLISCNIKNSSSIKIGLFPTVHIEVSILFRPQIINSNKQTEVVNYVKRIRHFVICYSLIQTPLSPTVLYEILSNNIQNVQ